VEVDLVEEGAGGEQRGRAPPVRRADAAPGAGEEEVGPPFRAEGDRAEAAADGLGGEGVRVDGRGPGLDREGRLLLPRRRPPAAALRCAPRRRHGASARPSPRGRRREHRGCDQQEDGSNDGGGR
jgi:hypothetical protein